MNIFKKIQNLPAHKKKIIFWSVLIVVGFLLLFFWGKNFAEKIRSLKVQNFLEEFKIPKILEEFKKIPKPSEDDLEKIEGIIKGAENQQKTNNK